MRPSAKLGYQIGVLCSLVVLVILLLPRQASLSTAGPANTGHETLQCQDCHVPAPGTARQQIQANTQYWLGSRDNQVDFQHQAVSNTQCKDCHVNPQDAHPAHRFNEPRFAQARVNIQPEDCSSCHLEHEGVRVTAEVTFCVECHQDLVLKNDPIDVSHEALIAQENWESCLGCHDFHGNHIMEEPTTIDNALKLEEIIKYFDGGPSPYSEQTLYEAKEPNNE